MEDTVSVAKLPLICIFFQLKLLNFGTGPVTPPSRESFTHAYGYNGPAFYEENPGMSNNYPYPPGNV